MNHDDKKKLYAALSAPFAADAIERTNGHTTGRGYDTAGIKAQAIVNRMNEVLGLGGFRIEHKLNVRPSTTARGRTNYEAVCELLLQLGEWIDGSFVPVAEARAVGGHASVVEADALKGALTNSLKRAAAFLGCGAGAYLGTLDDDNVPGASADEEGTHQHQKQAAPHAVAPLAARGGHMEHDRLTARQLAALWALARKLDIDKAAFRDRVRARFKTTLELLDRNTASGLISELSAKLGNGHDRRDDADRADEAA